MTGKVREKSGNFTIEDLWEPCFGVKRSKSCAPFSSLFVLFIFVPGNLVPIATLVIVVVVVNSLKIPMAFLICSRAQRNFAYTLMLTLPTDLPSQIFHILSN